MQQGRHLVYGLYTQRRQFRNVKNVFPLMKSHSVADLLISEEFRLFGMDPKAGIETKIDQGCFTSCKFIDGASMVTDGSSYLINNILSYYNTSQGKFISKC